jgi:hypothetical protein
MTRAAAERLIQRLLSASGALNDTVPQRRSMGTTTVLAGVKMAKSPKIGRINDPIADDYLDLLDGWRWT